MSDERAMQERLLQELERASASTNSDQAYANMLYLYQYRGGYNNIASLSCQRVFASLTVGVCFLICTCLIDWSSVMRCTPGECRVIEPHLPGLVGCLFLLTYIFGGFVYIVMAREEHRLLKRARVFFTRTLGIPDDSLHIMEWSNIMEIISTLDPPSRPVPHVDIKQMTQLIMRDTNYLIMLANSKELHPDTLSRPVQALLWYFFCLPIFCEGKMNKTLLANAYFLNRQKQRAMLIGALLSPFIFAWMTMSFVIGNIRIRNMRDTEITKRVFSQRARLRLRHFNELPHIFDERIARATELANKYLDAFPNPYTSAIETFFVYSIGVCMTVIALIGIVNEKAMTIVQIGNYNMLWWFAVLTACLSLVRRAPSEPVVLSITESRELLQLLSKYTLRSFDAEELHQLRKMLQPKWTHMVLELTEAFVCPMRIWKIDVVATAKFVADNTMFGTPVGDVCSLSHTQIVTQDDNLNKKMRQSWHAFAFSYSVSMEDIEAVENEFPVSRMDESEHMGTSVLESDSSKSRLFEDETRDAA